VAQKSAKLSHGKHPSPKSHPSSDEMKSKTGSTKDKRKLVASKSKSSTSHSTTAYNFKSKNKSVDVTSSLFPNPKKTIISNTGHLPTSVLTNNPITQSINKASYNTETLTSVFSGHNLLVEPQISNPSIDFIERSNNADMIPKQETGSGVIKPTPAIRAVQESGLKIDGYLRTSSRYQANTNNLLVERNTVSSDAVVQPIGDVSIMSVSLVTVSVKVTGGKIDSTVANSHDDPVNLTKESNPIGGNIGLDFSIVYTEQSNSPLTSDNTKLATSSDDSKAVLEKPALGHNATVSETLMISENQMTDVIFDKNVTLATGHLITSSDVGFPLSETSDLVISEQVTSLTFGNVENVLTNNNWSTKVYGKNLNPGNIKGFDAKFGRFHYELHFVRFYNLYCT